MSWITLHHHDKSAVSIKSDSIIMVSEMPYTTGCSINIGGGFFEFKETRIEVMKLLEIKKAPEGA